MDKERILNYTYIKIMIYFIDDIFQCFKFLIYYTALFTVNPVTCF
jgi:hypothetical protein